jgi:hypothetical protein
MYHQDRNNTDPLRLRCNRQKRTQKLCLSKKELMLLATVQQTTRNGGLKKIQGHK